MQRNATNSSSVLHLSFPSFQFIFQPEQLPYLLLQNSGVLSFDDQVLLIGRQVRNPIRNLLFLLFAIVEGRPSKATQENGKSSAQASARNRTKVILRTDTETIFRFPKFSNFCFFCFFRFFGFLVF